MILEIDETSDLQMFRVSFSSSNLHPFVYLYLQLFPTGLSTFYKSNTMIDVEDLCRLSQSNRKKIETLYYHLLNLIHFHQIVCSYR